MQKTPFLLLIIYILFSPSLYSQNLHLNINGENKKDSQLIDSLGYIKSHKDYSSIKNEIDSLQTRLNKIGYVENEVLKIEKTNDSTFAATFSLKNKFDTIYIYYNKDEVEKAILNQISNEVFDDYFIIPIQDVEDALNFINSGITEQGLPFSSLKLTDIKIRTKDILSSNLIISRSNKKRNINNIVIKGYESFSKSYLKHYLKIKPNEVFNLESIKEKIGLLKDLRFASQIKSPEVLFTKDSTSLYLYIEKKQSNTFDGFLGFGTNEETNKIEFDGYLNLKLENNLNYGESFGLIYKSDENEQKTFNANLNLPYLFGTAIGTELELNIFKKDSSFTTVNQAARIYYQLNSKSKVYAGITSTQSNNLLSDNSFSSIEDYGATFYNVRFQHIRRRNNSNLFATNFLLDIEAGLGTRDFENTSIKQSQVNFDIFKIFNFNPKNSIFLRTQGYGLFSDIFLENELIRFGGINSIRGFEENSIPASLYGLVNAEYRFQLNSNIYIHTITDAAYFENEVTKLKEKLFGFGFGFGIITKSGLLRFNYANGKNENTKFKLQNSKIHISLTAAF